MPFEWMGEKAAYDIIMDFKQFLCKQNQQSLDRLIMLEGFESFMGRFVIVKSDLIHLSCIGDSTSHM